MTPDPSSRTRPSFTSLEAHVTAHGLEAAVWHGLRLRWGYPGGQGAGRTLRVVAGSRSPRPPGPPTPVPVSGEVLEVWTRDDEVWLGETLHLQAGPGGATLTAAGSGVPDTAWVLAFVEAHRAGGWLPLHACVLSGEGDAGAVAVTGVSGAGKSTAALRLAGRGYAVLAEDQVWIHPPTAQVVGFDTHLRAFEDSVRRFAPHLLPRAAGHDAHGKLLLPLTRPGGQARLRSLLVFGLPARPVAAERVRALWEATGVPLTASGRRAAAAGVTALLPHLSIRGVTREDVLEKAETALAETARAGAAPTGQDTGSSG